MIRKSDLVENRAERSRFCPPERFIENHLACKDCPLGMTSTRTKYEQLLCKSDCPLMFGTISLPLLFLPSTHCPLHGPAQYRYTYLLVTLQVASQVYKSSLELRTVVTKSPVYDVLHKTI